MGPVDGGSARDLRAAAITANPARQLTGLCATAHRPYPRAQVSSRDFFREREKKPGEKKFTHRPAGADRLNVLVHEPLNRQVDDAGAGGMRAGVSP